MINWVKSNSASLLIFLTLLNVSLFMPYFFSSGEGWVQGVGVILGITNLCAIVTALWLFTLEYER